MMENEFLPTCNFPLHHHIKQTSLRSLKSISSNKTLEHLPKSKDAMIHLTVVEVPSPDVTVGVSKSRLCVRAETGFYPAENIEVDSKSYGGSNCTTFKPGSSWRCISLFGVNQSINPSIKQSIYLSIYQIKSNQIKSKLIGLEPLVNKISPSQHFVGELLTKLRTLLTSQCLKLLGVLRCRC